MPVDAPYISTGVLTLYQIINSTGSVEANGSVFSMNPKPDHTLHTQRWHSHEATVQATDELLRT